MEGRFYNENMVFGKRKRQFSQDNYDEDGNGSHGPHGTNEQEDSGDEIQEVTVASTPSQPTKNPTADLKQKPLLREVTITTAAAQGKASGGSKRWICNHCKKEFTSSYTRIHAHFFGPEVGKRCDIQRCPAMLKDRKEM